MAGITLESEFKTLLEFYHDLGVIVYYGKSGMLDSTLRNTVILRPQWLVDMFKRVITYKDMDQQVSFLASLLNSCTGGQVICSIYHESRITDQINWYMVTNHSLMQQSI